MTTSTDSLPLLPDALNPSGHQRARMARIVRLAVQAEQTSLWDEWVELLRARPVLHGCYVLAAAALLLWMTPLGALPLALVR